MRKIIIVSAFLSTALASSCAIKDLEPREEAAYVSRICTSMANHMPPAEDIVYSDATRISYSDCMADHGYLEKISTD